MRDKSSFLKEEFRKNSVNFLMWFPIRSVEITYLRENLELEVNGNFA